MKKYLLLLTGCVLTTTIGYSQDLLGLGTGNYAGITGMTLNPASIVDSRLKFDINLIGISNYYSNNYLSVKRDALVRGSFFKDKYKDWSLVQRDLLEENRLGANEKVNFRLNNRVIAPVSFMLTTGKKSAIALSITNRTGVTVENLNQDFARLAYNSFNDASMYNRNIDLSGINMNVLNWIDIGFTYGRVLLDRDKHFLKAAFTAKYIGGTASGYFQADQLSLSFSDKNTINANTPYAQYGHGEKLSLDMFKSASLRSLRPEAEGFGWNAGIVYEYRGKIDKFKYLTPESEEKVRRDVNKYAFRIGFAIMDAGRLTFNKSNLNNDFSAAINDWYLKDYKIRSINSVDSMLSDRVNYIVPGKENYSVALPTAYSAQIDLHLAKGFYLNAMTYQPFNLMKADRRMRVEGAYALTPRFESRIFGMYLPVTYNKFDEWNVGATIRLGPIYFGSANLGSLLFNNKTKTADIHAGLRIPITYGSPSRVAKLFDKITTKKDTTVLAAKATAAPVVATSQPITKEKDTVLAKMDAELQALKARLHELEKQRLIDSVRHVYQNQPAERETPVTITINNFAGAGTSSVKIDTVVKTNTRQVKIARDTVVTYKQDTALAKQLAAYQQYVDTLNRQKNAQVDTLLRILAEREIRLRDMEKKKAMLKDSSHVQQDTLSIKAAPVKEKKERRRKKEKPVSDSSAVQKKLSDTLLLKEAARVQPLAYSATDSSYTALQKEIAALKEMLRSATAQPDNTPNDVKKLEDELAGLRNNINSYRSDNAMRSNANNKDVEEELERLRDELRSSNRQLSDGYSDAQKLEDEIARLRSELRISNNQPPAPIVIQPAPQTSFNPAQLLTPAAIVASSAQQQQPIVIRDTVYIKETPANVRPTAMADTVVVRDTVVVQKEIAKTKTIDNTRDHLLTMQLEKILFKVNQVTIQPLYRKTLNFVADNLNTYPELALQIDGYTDKTGTPAINERLSLQRANAVRRYLLNRHVQPDQLRVQQHGADEPIADNTTSTGQALNRRVELRFKRK
ncbi:MAG: DUF5723 family protein [Agriterribacter sp.]